MATDSKFPKGENFSKPMVAYLQVIESRFPSDTSAVSTTASLSELIERFNLLITDLNKK